MLTNNDVNVVKLYEQFKTWGSDLNGSSIMVLLTELIPAVQKLIKHRGDYKKKVVLDTLKLMISESNIEESIKSLLNNIVENTIPVTIDIIVSVAKGEIDIGKQLKSLNCCSLS